MAISLSGNVGESSVFSVTPNCIIGKALPCVSPHVGADNGQRCAIASSPNPVMSRQWFQMQCITEISVVKIQCVSDIVFSFLFAVLPPG